MTDHHDIPSTCPEGEVSVCLRPVDCDAILAALEWAHNHEDLDLGPGLHRRNVEEAGRRIEAVADLARQGIPNPMPTAIIGLIPPPHEGFTGKCPCGCGVEFKDGKQVIP